MVKFASAFFNKRALKRALKEIENEDSLQSQLASVNVVPTREYKTEDEAEQRKKIVHKNALSKPQTEAVDLKHFKDWRNIDKVESKNSPYVPKQRFNIFDDDDEGEQPEIESPVSVSKPNIVSKIAGLNSADDLVKEKKDTDIATFFKEKYKIMKDSKTVLNKETSTETLVEKVDQTKKKETNIKASVKTSLNELLKKRQPEEKKEEEKKADNFVKIEVVDFTEKKEEKKEPLVQKTVNKKPTNRKPRGKNKRKYDADVISAVDWK